MLENMLKEYLKTGPQKGRRYIVEEQEDGKLLFLPCWSEAPEEAPSVPARDTALLKEYAEKWLDAAKRNVKESTYMKYWNLLYSYILPELGGMEWSALTRETIEAFCGRLLSAGGKKKSGLSPKTVTDIMSVLRRIFDYASACGASLPSNISTITIKKETKETNCLTRKEQDRLCRYLRMNPSDRNLGLLICIFTGLRLGEVCALTWNDISFTEQTIYVHGTMQRIQTKDDPERRTKVVITSPKSRSSVRRIPIPRELMRILFSCRKGRSGYVLSGTPEAYVEPRTMERHFDRVLKQLGMEHINFHALRHTFATRCVEMNFDVKSLSEILGHANVSITMNRYVHPTMELKRRNMQKLSALMAVG